MAKNKQSPEVNQPVWFDGKSINEACFVMISRQTQDHLHKRGFFHARVAV